MLLRLLVSSALALVLASCAGTAAKTNVSAVTAFAPMPEKPKFLKANDPVPMEPRKWGLSDQGTALTGRSLTVSRLSDIKLEPKEVVLTFDDGPAPHKTDRILAILDSYHVNATFMMIGEMAHNNPGLAQEVVAHGNEVGSHTFHHPDLKRMGFDQAMKEIQLGEDNVRAALGGREVGFFRFPYLSDTPQLRHALAERNVIALGADIDSKDYFRDTPDQVLARTMAEINKRKSGVILMHDIHPRTVAMLPLLLDRLKAEGYTVVSLHYQHPQAELLAQKAKS